MQHKPPYAPRVGCKENAHAAPVQAASEEAAASDGDAVFAQCIKRRALVKQGLLQASHGGADVGVRAAAHLCS